MRKTKPQYQLDITTSMGCPNLYSYCPQEVIVRAYSKHSDIRMMPFERFVNCLNHIPHQVHLNFSGFSAPWLNPECSRMIWYASHRGHTLSASTTLTGLTVTDLEQIKHIRFHAFEVHLPGNKNRTQIKVDSEYLETVKALLKKPLHNLHWKFHRNTPDVEIHEDLAPLFAEAKIQIEYTGIKNRAGMINTGTEHPTPNRDKVLTPCAEFRKNVLLPNGDVVLCHTDWSIQHILGNLLTQPYESLFVGEEYLNIQQALIDASLPLLCRNCEKDIVKRNGLQQVKKRFREKRIPGR